MVVLIFYFLVYIVKNLETVESSELIMHNLFYVYAKKRVCCATSPGIRFYLFDIDSVLFSAGISLYFIQVIGILLGRLF